MSEVTRLLDARENASDTSLGLSMNLRFGSSFVALAEERMSFSTYNGRGLRNQFQVATAV